MDERSNYERRLGRAASKAISFRSFGVIDSRSASSQRQKGACHMTSAKFSDFFELPLSLSQSGNLKVLLSAFGVPPPVQTSYVYMPPKAKAALCCRRSFVGLLQSFSEANEDRHAIHAGRALRAPPLSSHSGNGLGEWRRDVGKSEQQKQQCTSSSALPDLLTLISEETGAKLERPKNSTLLDLACR